MMSLSNAYGFQIIRSRKVAELNGTLHEMTHVKTGAKLCWLDNGQANKLFGIAFTSLPSDDSGVFHILEHSVLCGSEKYPVKEPFLESGLAMNLTITARTTGLQPYVMIYVKDVRDGASGSVMKLMKGYR